VKKRARRREKGEEKEDKRTRTREKVEENEGI